MKAWWEDCLDDLQKLQDQLKGFIGSISLRLNSLNGASNTTYTEIWCTTRPSRLMRVISCDIMVGIKSSLKSVPWGEKFISIWVFRFYANPQYLQICRL